MSDLKFFIRNQKSLAATGVQANWSKRREKWLREIDAVFDWVRSELISAGLESNHIKIEQVTLNEETLGVYQAPTLLVNFPTQLSIEFRPKASVIIGGYGRIDVGAPHSPKRIMLIAADADVDRDPTDLTPASDRAWIWRVFPGRATQGSYALDSEGLGKLFEVAVS